MDQIAERADVARATVFNHFSQKVSFLEEWGARRRASVSEILGQQHFEDLPVGDRLRRYLREMAELNIASRAETAVLMEASARFGRLLQDPSLETELTRIIDDDVRHDEVRPEVDPHHAGALLAAGYFSGIIRWIGAEPAPFDLPERRDISAACIRTVSRRRRPAALSPPPSAYLTQHEIRPPLQTHQGLRLHPDEPKSSMKGRGRSSVGLDRVLLLLGSRRPCWSHRVAEGARHKGETGYCPVPVCVVGHVGCALHQGDAGWRRSGCRSSIRRARSLDCGAAWCGSAHGRRDQSVTRPRREGARLRDGLASAVGPDADHAWSVRARQRTSPSRSP